MRESAVNFLAAVDSLIQQEPRPACWEVSSHVRGFASGRQRSDGRMGRLRGWQVYVQQDGDSELLFEEPGNRTQGDSHKPKVRHG